LFVYAALNRDQTFYLSTILPIRVTFLAWLALAALLTGVFFGSKSNLAALAGAVVGFGYYVSQRVRVLAIATREGGPAPRLGSEDAAVVAATRNITAWRRLKRALVTGSDSDINRLIDLASARGEPEVSTLRADRLQARALRPLLHPLRRVRRVRPATSS
jgi:hypothetical protein